MRKRPQGRLAKGLTAYLNGILRYGQAPQFPKIVMRSLAPTVPSWSTSATCPEAPQFVSSRTKSSTSRTPSGTMSPEHSGHA